MKGKSKRRRTEQAAKRQRKAAGMLAPGGNSKYARKCRGIYPPNSPYLNVWRHFVVG